MSVVLCCDVGPVLAGGTSAQKDGPVEVVDRVVAIVDDDPILLSEIHRTVELGLVQPKQGEIDFLLRRRALDSLIEQRLRLHELDRYGGSDVQPEVIEQQVESLRDSLGGEQALQDRLTSMGMTKRDLQNLYLRQVQVLRFVEERLGPRVFVDADDIRVYYDQVLLPELRSDQDPDSPVPPPELAEVREMIREVLTQQRLNEEIAGWTLELRRAANVLDFFEEDGTILPDPVN